jgi:very-short-patch-repair endonuclease
VRFAQIHYVSDAREDVFDALDGLRVSTPARAVFEAASRLDEFGLRSMIQSGLKNRAFTVKELEQVGQRLCAPGRRGTRLFRSVVAQTPTEPPVHTEAELVMLDALRAAGLDAHPQYPVQLSNGATVHLDIGIPRALVGVEIDGNSHDDPVVAHRDKSRDLHVSAQGWQVVRVPEPAAKRNTRVVTAHVVRICAIRAGMLGVSP